MFETQSGLPPTEFLYILFMCLFAWSFQGQGKKQQYAGNSYTLPFGMHSNSGMQRIILKVYRKVFFNVLHAF